MKQNHLAEFIHFRRGHPASTFVAGAHAHVLVCGPKLLGMGEIIVAVDPLTGRDIGTVDRDVAHREGVWHASVHVWILDANGHVLLQQRSAQTRHFPQHWDITAAGHLQPGEDGTREVAEEVGVHVSVEQMKSLGNFTLVQQFPEGWNRERPRVYVYHSELDLSDLRFPDGEVMAAASVPVNSLVTLVRGKTALVPVLRNGSISAERINSDQLVPLGARYWERLFAYLQT
jgi:isopentenyldiphosphate isomerase